MSEELIKLLETPIVWIFAQGLFLKHKENFENLSDKCDTTTFKINDIIIKVILIELHKIVLIVGDKVNRFEVTIRNNNVCSIYHYIKDDMFSYTFNENEKIKIPNENHNIVSGNVYQNQRCASYIRFTFNNKKEITSIQQFYCPNALCIDDDKGNLIVCYDDGNIIHDPIKIAYALNNFSVLALVKKERKINMPNEFFKLVDDFLK